MSLSGISIIVSLFVPLLNQNKNFCYRIFHIENISHALEFGLCNKNHPNANAAYKSIGNTEIIDVRSLTKVNIANYGYIGDYVPFYFTPKSIMLFNIVTGYYAPKVPKIPKEDIVVLRCLIEDLTLLDKFFFTDGQANAVTNHYNDLKHLEKVDWDNIQNSNFSKNGDPDRPRRYQAEFLVYNHVPVSSFESLHVYNKKAQDYIKRELDKIGIINLQVAITRLYFFD